MTGFSDTLRSGWIDQLAAMPHWGALFSADPLGVGTPSSVEVPGGTYARQDTSGLWTRSSVAVLTLNTACIFRGLPPGASVAAVGFFDSAFGSTGFLHRALLPAAVNFPSGGTWVLPAGEYAAGLDLS